MQQRIEAVDYCCGKSLQKQLVTTKRPVCCERSRPYQGFYAPKLEKKKEIVSINTSMVYTSCQSMDPPNYRLVEIVHAYKSPFR